MSFDTRDYRGGYILGTVFIGTVAVWSSFSQTKFLENTSLLAIYLTLIVIQVSLILAYHSFDVISELID